MVDKFEIGPSYQRDIAHDLCRLATRLAAPVADFMCDIVVSLFSIRLFTKIRGRKSNSEVNFLESGILQGRVLAGMGLVLPGRIFQNGW